MTQLDSHGESQQAYLPLEKYSLGVGDRFAHQAKAQLRAIELVEQDGVAVTPVWNKSHREHVIVGSEPASVRAAVEAAARQMGWKKPFHIDADHITLKTVDGFLESSDYFTIDVADSIGQPAAADEVNAFVARHPEFTGSIDLPGGRVPAPSRCAVQETAAKYLRAARDAAEIYRYIASRKDPQTFIAEVSMDETDRPQKPAELLIILAALADESVPLQAIAPKFTGRFNKGVDYVGAVREFESEFRADIAVIAHAVKAYQLPPALKLSVHSGSDKFSIYPAIHRAIQETGAGLHLKTAGTTWLEELIGLAESGGRGLALVKEIYAQAYARREELCAPYAAVIDIDPARLPAPSDVREWSSDRFANALRHDRNCPEFNPSFRQLLHVGYKIAAGMGKEYLDLLDACEPAISCNVTANLYERHLKPLFLGAGVPATAR
jgi:hypothetical protein